MTDIVWAVRFGELEKVQQFIASGGDVNTRDEHGDTLLQIASGIGDYHRDVVNALLAAGADPNASGPGGYTALFRAISASASTSPQGREGQNIDVLLAAGADVNAVNELGDSPLIHAIEKDCSLSIIRNLIRAGANINFRTRAGPNPLVTALMFNKLPEAELLLDAGADITIEKFRDGKSILDFAVMGAMPPEARALILQAHRSRVIRRRAHVLSSFLKTSRKQRKASRRRSRHARRH